MFKSGLIFIINHLDIEGELPIPLIEDHTLRSANSEEIKTIETHLNLISVVDLPRRTGTPYRHLFKSEVHGTSTTFFSEELPEDKWKYWVVAFEGTNHKISELEHATSLLPFDFDFGMGFLFRESKQVGKPSGMMPMRFHNVEKYLEIARGCLNAKKVNSTDISKTRIYYEKIGSLPAEASFIKQAVENFHLVKTLSKNSRFRVVGYFSIIELLVTHDQRRNESLNSVTHQIVNKLILLSKRFDRKIPLDHFLIPHQRRQLGKSFIAIEAEWRTEALPISKTNFNCSNQMKSCAIF